jgi:hypothetical protein
VFARVFDGQGAPVGTEFRIGQTFATSSPTVTVAATPNGGFAVAFAAATSAKLRRFDAAGAPLGPELNFGALDSGRNQRIGLAVNHAGEALLTWVWNQRLLYRLLGSEDTPLTFEVHLPFGNDKPAHSTVGVDATGRFVVAWQADSTTGLSDVYHLRFSRAGVPAAASRVNTHQPANQRFPALAVAPGGSFTVAWQSDFQDGSGQGIYLQRYAPHSNSAPVSGRLWADSNGDGVRQDNEAIPATATTVQLIDHRGVAVDALTSTDGTYAFAGLAPGAPHAVQLPGAGLTLRDRGADDARDSDFDQLTRQSDPFTPGQSQAVTGPDAGLAAPGELLGIVYHDVNADGRRDGADRVMPGRLVFLDADGDGQADPAEPTARSAADGAFAFAAVPTGTYRLLAVPQPHWSTTTPVALSTYDIAPGARVTGALLGVHSDSPQLLVRATGAQTPVNTHTAGVQRAPVVGMDAAGNTVVAWMSDGQDGSSWGIFARRFDPGGAPLTPEIQVNQFTAGAQQNPAISVNSAGRFVVAWESADQDGSGLGVYARAFDASGAPVGDEFLVGTETQRDQSDPTVAVSPGGTFLVAWTHRYGSLNSEVSVLARRFDSNATPLGPAFVAADPAYAAHQPSLGVGPAGHIVLAWVAAQNADGSSAQGTGSAVIARRLDAAGAPLTPIVLAGRTVEPGTIPPDQSRPAVAVDSAGGFVIAWESFGIRAQRFDALGAPAGGQVRADAASSAGISWPSVVMDAAGHYVVAWQSTQGGASGRATFAQAFNAANFASGPNVRLDANPSATPTAPGIAMNAAGRIAIVGGRDDLTLQPNRLELAGDADGDGRVTFIDFQRLEVAFQKIAAAWEEGDFTRDGVVNHVDFRLMYDNFGKSYSPTPPPPPEAIAAQPVVSSKKAPPVFAVTPIRQTPVKKPIQRAIPKRNW